MPLLQLTIDRCSSQGNRFTAASDQLFLLRAIKRINFPAPADGAGRSGFSGLLRKKYKAAKQLDRAKAGHCASISSDRAPQ
jgi:hypothetical protein